MASYELLKSLDRGGMAEVFLARLVGVQGFEKRVVLKRVLPHLAADERFVERFFDEARTAAQLAHPNVVQIFELGEERGQYFIAMEYVEGKNVRDVCKTYEKDGERLPVEHSVRILAQVLDGLEHAHTRRGDDGRPLGIVHRDVSPSNILITWDGGIKLIDFGIAKSMARHDRTRPGSVIGKAGYMSPEQCRGETVDHRSDIYAAGSVLYRMVTRKIAFPGRSEPEVVQAVAAGRIVHPHKRRADLDDALVDILLRALAPRPAERFQSAREMQTALEKYLATSGKFSSAGLVAEMMSKLFAEERAFDTLPKRDESVSFEETKSRVVTLVGTMPSVEIPVLDTVSGEAPRPEELSSVEGEEAESDAEGSEPLGGDRGNGMQPLPSRVGDAAASASAPTLIAQTPDSQASFISDGTIAVKPIVISEPTPQEPIPSLSAEAISEPDFEGRTVSTPTLIQLEPEPELPTMRVNAGRSRVLLAGSALVLVLTAVVAALVWPKADATSVVAGEAQPSPHGPGDEAEPSANNSNQAVAKKSETNKKAAPEKTDPNQRAAAKKQDGKTTEPKKAEPKASELKKAESKKAESKKAESKKAESKKAESRKTRPRSAKAKPKSARTKPKPSKPRTKATKPRSSGKPGIVTVLSLPWATVYVDGKKRGVTPISRMLLSPGKHKIELVGEGGKLRKTVVLEVESEKTYKVKKRLDR